MAIGEFTFTREPVFELLLILPQASDTMSSSRPIRPSATTGCVSSPDAPLVAKLRSTALERLLVLSLATPVLPAATRPPLATPWPAPARMRLSPLSGEPGYAYYQ